MTQVEVVGERSFPALVRGVREVYADALRRALADAGCDDIPRNGMFVISAIAWAGAPLSALIGQLGVSKQAAGYLVDTLVTRGYLERTIDPEDRRRLVITLTARGSAAAEIIRSVVDGIEARLVATVGEEAVATTRATLVALIVNAGIGA